MDTPKTGCSTDCDPMPPSPNETLTLRLSLRNLPPVPSFKNTKMIAGIRRVPGQKNLWRGTPFIATNPKKKQWMQEASRSFASQLRCACQTIFGATWTAARQPSLIASVTPLDDSSQVIPKLVVQVLKVPKGQEGVDVTIERL